MKNYVSAWIIVVLDVVQKFLLQIYNNYTHTL